MKAQFLHISFWFHGEIDIAALENTFDTAIDWMRYMPDCWIVRTTSSQEKWFARLSPFLGDDDSILIVKIDLREKTARLPAMVVEWINRYVPENFLIPHNTSDE